MKITLPPKSNLGLPFSSNLYSRVNSGLCITSLELTQPSVSHHIKKLTEADIILAHKEGRFYSYSINEKLLDNYVNTLKNL